MDDVVTNWVDAQEIARSRGRTSLRQWINRQHHEQTHVQRLVSLIQQADMECRPPPCQACPLMFRGQPYELVCWGPTGFHPESCVWFPGKEKWVLLRHAAIIAPQEWLIDTQGAGTTDLLSISKHTHESVA